MVEEEKEVPVVEKRSKRATKVAVHHDRTPKNTPQKCKTLGMKSKAPKAPIRVSPRRACKEKTSDADSHPSQKAASKSKPTKTTKKQLKGKGRQNKVDEEIEDDG